MSFRSIAFFIIFMLYGVCAWSESLDGMADVAEYSGEESEAAGSPNWLVLEDGLEFSEMKLGSGELELTVVRIDPEKFDFVLGASSMDGRKPRSLRQWGEEYNFKTAINASMYLPDNKTSTGYMRSGEHVNNPRMAERFGAFFVAGPRNASLPGASILTREEPRWRELMDQYEVVVQNYRMINSQGRILWSKGGPMYSISAVAQDKSGKILFLHAHEPVEAYEFVRQLLALPLDIQAIMYVEGGAQAGLLVNSEKIKRDMSGVHLPSMLITGNIKAQLPNVLGVVPRRGSY